MLKNPDILNKIRNAIFPNGFKDIFEYFNIRIMADILVNPLHTNNDVCSICLDDLTTEQIYQLPECGHVYHTNCILQWMRSGHNKCPYCGNIGECSQSNNNHNQIIYYYNAYNHDQYIILRQFSRRNDAPIKLKKQVNRLRILEKRLKDTTKQFKELELKSGTFKEMKKQHQKIKGEQFSIKSRIRRLKHSICTSNNITPLILVKKKIIN